MPVFFLPTTVAVLAVAALLTREGGVSFLGFHVDLWSLFIQLEPRPTTVLLAENLTFWACTYVAAYVFLYMEPGRTAVRPLKFNQHYRSLGLELQRQCNEKIPDSRKTAGDLNDESSSSATDHRT